MTKIQQVEFISGDTHKDVQLAFNKASSELDNVQALGFNVVNSTVILAYTYDVTLQSKETKAPAKKRTTRKPKVQSKETK